MFWWSRKQKSRRGQVRKQRAKLDAGRQPGLRRVLSWQAAVSVAFVAVMATIPILGRNRLQHSLGQRIDQPIHAKVDFEVPDPTQSKADRMAARAATPSHYVPNAPALTSDRIRADLLSLYQAAAASEEYSEFESVLVDRGWPADARCYKRLRKWVEMPEGVGIKEYEDLIDRLSFDRELIVADLIDEPRDTPSTASYVILTTTDANGKTTSRKIERSELVSQKSERALRASATAVARKLRSYGAYELAPVVEDIIFRAYSEQPTILFDQERTVDAMRRAEEATPEAMKPFERGKLFIEPGTVLGSTEIGLLKAHQAAYRRFLESDRVEAEQARLEEFLRRLGAMIVVGLLSTGLLIYMRMHQPRNFEAVFRCGAFLLLVAVTVLTARLLELKWPQIPELVLVPCLVAASVLSIVYPRRFAVGTMCITAVIVAVVVGGDVTSLLALFTGIAVTSHQLTEIRSRSKLIETGLIAAAAVMMISLAGGLTEGRSLDSLREHILWSGGCAMLALLVSSGLLPLIERAFRVATSLSLLEWRDPTRELLQLLARHAPGTYNHSLVLGTLAEAACERIGANGLLAQVGALYHDIGKIHKADYFIENQVGGVNRHDNLAPTMSLLIIVGHVKDGMEMAKEYKLPRVLHQFIAEHHGTTVVRFFHHIASEQQPKIASGKHDREVPEAEFRYGGPKPRTKESAVVMLCDGVEGAVRSLNEPTVGRIENVVHQIVQSRVNDGQLSDCDMTMREIQLVEDSLVKTLGSIYHGRVAYPKAAKPPEAKAKSGETQRVTAS
ncbi:MAG: HD family phosphohydrolase [Phycisphaerae bacterium]